MHECAPGAHRDAIAVAHLTLAAPAQVAAHAERREQSEERIGSQDEQRWSVIERAHQRDRHIGHRLRGPRRIGSSGTRATASAARA